jgi:hypothetical protein
LPFGSPFLRFDLGQTNAYMLITLIESCGRTGVCC